MNKEQASKEAAKIIDDCIKKAAEIEAKAKKDGTWKKGLDANRALFEAIKKERNDKLKLLASMVDKE